ncbi:MAG: MBL fold metallo-hydrolase [Acidimicrobiales bacterium]
MSLAAERPRKQEQEPASTEITEISPGVLRLQIPINFTGLGHVNSYALLDGSGAAIVDAGLPGRETWSAIKARLAAAGLKMRDIHTVVVTHSHPDHFGSAGRLAHAADADLVAQRRFHTWFERPGNARDYSALVRAPRTPWGGEPFPTTRRQQMVRKLAPYGLVPNFRAPMPSRRVDDGDILELGGRRWRAVHTPGHTGDHLCLYDPEEGLLLSGDHVLPTITPHVAGLSLLADPLGSFLESLALVLTIGPVSVVLPAHGHPFPELEERVRQIVDHHDDRLADLRRISRETGQATVVEFSRELFRKSLWGMMAESETFAHLEFLRIRGDATQVRLADGQLAYSLDPEGTSSARAVAFKD